MAVPRHREPRGTPSESLGKPPCRSRGRTAGGRWEALTMPRIACGSPPARRIARAISMGYYQRSLVLVAAGARGDHPGRAAAARPEVAPDPLRPEADLQLAAVRRDPGRLWGRHAHPPRDQSDRSLLAHRPPGKPPPRQRAGHRRHRALHRRHRVRDDRRRRRPGRSDSRYRGRPADRPGGRRRPQPGAFRRLALAPVLGPQIAGPGRCTDQPRHRLARRQRRQAAGRHPVRHRRGHRLAARPCGNWA